MGGSSARTTATRRTIGWAWDRPPACATSAAGSARPEALMVAHVVLFKPRPGLDASTRQRLADAFQQASREIPSIRRAHIGRRVMHGRPYEQLMTVDYEYAAIMEFDSAAGLAAYLAHDAHEALGRLFFDAFEVALMYDYEMTSDAAALLPEGRGTASADGHE